MASISGAREKALKAAESRRLVVCGSRCESKQHRLTVLCTFEKVFGPHIFRTEMHIHQT